MAKKIVKDWLYGRVFPVVPWFLHQVEWKAAQCKIKSNRNLEKFKLLKCIFRVINFLKNLRV